MNNMITNRGTVLPVRDVVDLMSEDSFPASDPPSWTPVVGIGPPPGDRSPSGPHPVPRPGREGADCHGPVGGEVVEQAAKGTPVAAEIDRLAAETGRMLRGRLTGLRIERVAGGVVLRGTARSYYAKQLALHTVMTGTGLPVVRNEIKVV